MEGDPTRQESFGIELPSGEVVQQTASLEDLLQPAPPSDLGTIIECANWESEFMRQLCYDGKVP